MRKINHNYNRMSVLLKQFTQGFISTPLMTYTKVMGLKSPTIINSIIPEAFTNIKNSAESFVEGLVDLDQEYIQNTSTKALKNVLIPQIQQLKSRNISLRLIDQSKPDSKLPPKMVTISPYVIFGQNMEKRLSLDKPWKYTMPILTTNRFIAVDEVDGISLKKIWNQHIYGFHCFYMDNRGLEITQNAQPKQYPARWYIISFQTNAVNHQFYVSDFNWLIKYNN